MPSPRKRSRSPTSPGERRRKKNRASAALSRRRKEERKSGLEADLASLDARMRQLRAENARLRNEIRYLKMIDDPKVLDMLAE